MININWDILLLAGKAAVLLIIIHTIYQVIDACVKRRKDMDRMVAIAAGCTLGLLFLGLAFMIGIFMIE